MHRKSHFIYKQNFFSNIPNDRTDQNANQPTRSELTSNFYVCNKINFASMIRNVIMIETATGWSRRRSMRLDRGSVVRATPLGQEETAPSTAPVDKTKRDIPN